MLGDYGAYLALIWVTWHFSFTYLFKQFFKVFFFKWRDNSMLNLRNFLIWMRKKDSWGIFLKMSQMTFLNTFLFNIYVGSFKYFGEFVVRFVFCGVYIHVSRAFLGCRCRRVFFVSVLQSYFFVLFTFSLHLTLTNVSYKK